MNRRIFFVLGMHRSGTSILDQTLSLMGLKLSESIRSGAIDNPKGHFESLTFPQLHDTLLNKLNNSWNSFIPLPPDWLSSKYAKKFPGR